MAIVNSYSTISYDLDTFAPTTVIEKDNDSEFGENLTRDINVINQTSGAAITIVNNYTPLYSNSFSATSQNSRNEQILIQSMVNESINANGVTIRYMPRYNSYVDEVFNEAPDAEFSKGYLADIVIKSAAGFEGEGDVLTQYGMEMKEEFDFVIGITRWQDLHASWINGLTDDEAKAKYQRSRPLEGDLVVVPFGRVAANSNQYFPKVFEILHVTTFHDGAFFQVGDNYQYGIKARLFDLSNEDLNFSPRVVDETGVEIVSDTVGPIARAQDKNEILDSENKFNIPRTNPEGDTWSRNTVIEQDAQEETKVHVDQTIEKTDRLTDDYVARMFGLNGVINNLDDI